MKKISIILVNWNGNEDTMACIASLKKLRIEKNFEVEIVVVDNASADTSLESISKNFPEVILLPNKENYGFAKGNNIGITYALAHNADFVFILNNDTIVDKNCLVSFLSFLDKNPGIGIVSPKIYFEKGHEFHKNRYSEKELGKVIWYAGGYIDWKNCIAFHKGVDEVDNGAFTLSQKIDFASGCAMFVRKEVFTRVGMFDERYFLYYEDSDFSQRVHKAGFSLMYCPDAFLWHKNASSAGGSGSFLQDYYITRNRLLFGLLYAPFRTKIALLKESLRLVCTGRRWQRRGVLDFYRGNLGKGSYS